MTRQTWFQYALLCLLLAMLAVPLVGTAVTSTLAADDAPHFTLFEANDTGIQIASNCSGGTGSQGGCGGG